jgi:hypothetical protein
MPIIKLPDNSRQWYDPVSSNHARVLLEDFAFDVDNLLLES